MISMKDFRNDPHGSRYADVIDDPVDGPALTSALRVMNRADIAIHMRAAVDRYGQPPLAPIARDIEAEPAFRAACRGGRGVASRRLKQAVGVACKLVMDSHGYVPADLKTGSPDHGRMTAFSNVFATARRYRKK